MITIIKNNIARIMEVKVNVTIYVILTICSVLVAMYMSDINQNAGSVAVLSQQHAMLKDNERLHVTYVDKEVPQSQLVMQKYDAYMYMDKGTWVIKTIKGKDFQQRVEAALQQKNAPVPNQSEGKGTRIVSYLLMFVMMQSIAYMSLFGEDKETNMMQRIMVSPITFPAYLMAQVIFGMVFTFLPAFLTVTILSFIGFDVGFTLLAYGGLLLLLSLFSTVFSLFMNSIIKVKDTANMAGSAIIVLTSILAGSFTSIQEDNSFFQTITSLLPQKAYLNITQALGQHAFTQNDILQFAYLLSFITVLFIGSILAMRKKT